MRRKQVLEFSIMEENDKIDKIRKYEHFALLNARLATQQKLNQGIKARIKKYIDSNEEIASFLTIKTLSVFHRSTL